MSNVGQSAATGAAQGATVGSAIPGIGTAIGMGVGALVGGGIGLSQYLKGKKLERENTRPTYQIPQEVFQNLTQAQQMALQGMPAEQQQAYIESLQQQTAYGLDQIASRKGGLVGLAGLVNAQNKGMQGLMAQDAAMRQQNQNNLMTQRQNIADYRGQEFQFNQLNPFYYKQAQAEALKGAGMQNMQQSVGNIAYGLGAAYDAYNKGGVPQQKSMQQGIAQNNIQQPQVVTPNPYIGQTALNLPQNNSYVYGLNAQPSIFRGQ